MRPWPTLAKASRINIHSHVSSPKKFFGVSLSVCITKVLGGIVGAGSCPINICQKAHTQQVGTRFAGECSGRGRGSGRIMGGGTPDRGKGEGSPAPWDRARVLYKCSNTACPNLSHHFPVCPNLPKGNIGKPVPAAPPKPVTPPYSGEQGHCGGLKKM